MDVLRRIHSLIGGRVLFLIGFLALCGAYEYGRVMKLRPLPMHMWRQTDCLSLTWNYYAGGASFASPQIHAQLADDGTSGYSAGEFPLLYWSVAQIWKVTGQSEFAYRLLGLIMHFFAAYALFLTLRRLLKSDFWAIGIALLWSTSPVIAYYTVGFLTDVPAFDLAVIGWYFFIRYATEQKKRYWILTLACWALAALLKVTAGMSLVAMLAIYALATVWPKSMGELSSVFPKPKFGWGVVLVALAGIMSWYIHAEIYNELHNGKYTFNGFWPLWDMDAQEIDSAIQYARDILVFQMFDTSVWLLVGIALIGLVNGRKQVPGAVLLLNVLLLIGTVIYSILWFHALDGHDYYFINPLIALLVPVVSWAWWLRNYHAELFNASWLRWAFLGLLGYNVAYAANNMNMRSNPNTELDHNDLLPVYHAQELKYWNSLVRNPVRDLYTITPYLRSLGIEPEDRVVCIDDPTINASLYFMGQPGRTGFGLDEDHAFTVSKYVGRGAKYLVVTEQGTRDDPAMQILYGHPLGVYGNTYIYDLRKLDRAFKAETIFQQISGQEIPAPHRNNALSCSDGTGWCYVGEHYPFEIDDLPIYGSSETTHVQLIVKGNITWEPGYDGGGEILFSENADDEQITLLPHPLGEGPFEVQFNLLPNDRITRNKLFFANTSGHGFELEGFEISVKQYFE
ncbi:MAG: glycosyltransferase family 39 protein [Flavobacteriales bacterium]